MSFLLGKENNGGVAAAMKNARTTNAANQPAMARSHVNNNNDSNSNSGSKKTINGNYCPSIPPMNAGPKRRPATPIKRPFAPTMGLQRGAPRGSAARPLHRPPASARPPSKRRAASITTYRSAMPQRRNPKTETDIVKSLQGALATLRRDRDDYHRRKQLAMERTRLLKDEHDVIASGVRDLEQEVRQAQDAIEHFTTAAGPLEEEIEQLAKEAQFQHAELLGAREKIKQIQSQKDEESRKYAEDLEEATVRLREVEQEASTMKITEQTPDACLEEQTEWLLQELECQTDGTSFREQQLPKWMEMKTSVIHGEIERIHDERAEMERMIAALENALEERGVHCRRTDLRTPQQSVAAPNRDVATSMNTNGDGHA